MSPSCVFKSCQLTCFADDKMPVLRKGHSSTGDLCNIHEGPTHVCSISLLVADVRPWRCGCERLEATFYLQEWLLPKPPCHSVVLEGKAMAAWVVLLLSLGWTPGGRKQPSLLFFHNSSGELSLPQVDPYQSTLSFLNHLTKAALFEEPTE